MDTVFHNPSDTIKGTILMLAGIVLLLNTLGITLKIIYILTLCGAISMIAYGFFQAGYYTKIVELFNKRKPNKPV
jgi:hypothetical protein